MNIGSNPGWRIRFHYVGYHRSLSDRTSTYPPVRPLRFQISSGPVPVRLVPPSPSSSPTTPVTVVYTGFGDGGSTPPCPGLCGGPTRGTPPVPTSLLPTHSSQPEKGRDGSWISRRCRPLPESFMNHFLVYFFLFNSHDSVLFGWSRRLGLTTTPSQDGSLSTRGRAPLPTVPRVLVPDVRVSWKQVDWTQGYGPRQGSPDSVYRIRRQPLGRDRGLGHVRGTPSPTTPPELLGVKTGDLRGCSAGNSKLTCHKGTGDSSHTVVLGLSLRSGSGPKPREEITHTLTGVRSESDLLPPERSTPDRVRNGGTVTDAE